MTSSPVVSSLFRSFGGLICILLTAIAVANLPACQKTPETNFVSLDTSVKYIGMAACKNCHEEIYRDYLQTGMGKSLYKPDKSKIIEDFGQTVYDAASDYYYQAFWAGAEFFIREFRLSGQDTVYRRTEKVDYIVGSGNQTRSYLMERNGYMYEMPITYYVGKKMWDLSPGYHEGHNSRFARGVGAECMNCHNGYSDFVEGTANRYRKVALGIDCERCHGAGAKHVRRMEDGEMIDIGKTTDYSIVNPAKMSADLQFDVCQQCHLQGTNVLYGNGNYRPGAPLSQAFDIFLPKKPDDPNAFGIASHAERLQESACFVKGKVSCVNCHNPHKSVHQTDPLVYVKACQKCHEKQACTEKTAIRAEKNDNCVTCHLPRGGADDIPHVRFTDHKIRVVRKETAPAVTKGYLELLCATQKAPTADAVGRAYLQYFEQQAADQTHLLKTALEKLAPESRLERSKALYYSGRLAEAESEARLSAEKQPQNTWALFHLATVLEKTGKAAESLELYEKCWRLNPSIVEASLNAATLHLKIRAGQPAALDSALHWLTIAEKLQPYNEKVLTALGFVAMNKGDFTQANAYLQKALQFSPDHPQALENLVYLSLAQKNKGQAQTYFKRLIKAQPTYAPKAALAKAVGL